MSNVPMHYSAATNGIETMDALRAIVNDDAMFEGFLLGNAIKYLARYRRKGDPRGDLLKAKDYIERLIALREEMDNG